MIALSPSGKIPDGNYNPSGSCSSYTPPAYSCGGISTDNSQNDTPSVTPNDMPGDDSLARSFHSSLVIRNK